MSRDVLTEAVDVTLLGWTNYLITAFCSDCKNSLRLLSSAHGGDIISTLIAPYDDPTDRNKVYESDFDGRHIDIYSRMDARATWQCDMTIRLTDRGFSNDRYSGNDLIQTAVR